MSLQGVKNNNADDHAPPAYADLCGGGGGDVVATAADFTNVPAINVGINGTIYTLQPTGGTNLNAIHVSPLLSTAEFIRTHTHWHGTKVACAEGGCGACTVAVTYMDLTTSKATTVGINACLRPILACDGMTITTNDGLVRIKADDASQREYNPIQAALAAHNGSQCGYCSNGFVMTMYTYLADNAQRGGTKVDALSIEEAFDGNLCRCTGYRPILDAMKSFAGGNSTLGDIFKDMPECKKTGCCRRKKKFNFEHIPDMEDVSKFLDTEEKKNKIIVDEESGKLSDVDRSHLLGLLERDVEMVKKLNNNNNATIHQQQQQPQATPGSPMWIPCMTIPDLNAKLVSFSTQTPQPSIMLVNGQTSLGVYKNTAADVRLYIGGIGALKAIAPVANVGIDVGSAVTIADVILFLESFVSPDASKLYNTKHFPQLVKHLKRIAGRQVRAVGSLCGNLMVAYAHQDPINGFFASDAATLMMGLGATVNVVDPALNKTTSHTMADFLGLNTSTGDGMYGKYILSIRIPFAASPNEHFMSYKIAMRQVNAHAYVNAAMMATFDPASGVVAPGSVILAIGGIEPRATRYTSIEVAMGNLQLRDTTKFRTIATSLTAELKPCPFSGKQDFRKSAAVNYLYKFFLFLQGISLPANLQSGSNCWMTRGVSSGTQQFQPDPKLFPVSAGIPKIEGIQQTSGNAKYAADETMPMGTLHVRLVLADQATATFAALDTTNCSSVDGYVSFVSATDLTAATNKWNNGVVFISVGAVIEYSGQAVGAVICKNEVACEQAAKLVKITYTNIKTPIVTMAAARAANSIFPADKNPPPVQRGNITNPLQGAATVVSGSTTLGYQYQFHLENHICTITPKEDILEVRSATQMPVQVQMAVAATCGLPSSKVSVSIRRCGGGFGGKITNSIFPAVVAAAACAKTQQPVTLTIPLQQATSLLGFRGGWILDYSIGFDSNNVITGMSSNLWGASGNVPSAAGHMKVALHSLENAYHIPNANFQCGGLLKMNIAGSASVRGPGWVPGMALMESVMNSAASQLNVDANDLREINLMQRGQTTCDGMPLPYMNIRDIWTQIKASAKLTDKRASIAEFNKNNRWSKRGLAITPIRFGMNCAGANFNANVTIYPDGTVAISHGGSEIGQGLNTKVIQVTAYKLGLTQEELKNVTCNETCTRDLAASSNVTGGSITGSMCSLAIMHACEELNRRLAPFRTSPTMPFIDLVTAADNAGVNLAAAGWSNAPAATGPSAFRFNTCAASLCEVELDGLTGQYEVKEVDILFDAGISLNPIIDIGQIEGGFIFGMGLFTSEEMSWDPVTARPLNGDTWEYKVPSAFDVPESFNIALLKDCPNPLGVLGAKVVGEPGVAMATSVWSALEDAITAVRVANGGPTNRWTCTNLPLTVDKIQQACGTSVANFTL